MMARYLPEKAIGSVPSTPASAAPPRFLQLGGSTRDLFYYPTATSTVIYVSPTANASLFQQAGIQAGISVDAHAVEFDDLGFRPSASVDGCLLLNALGATARPLLVMEQVVRVLKPGAPMLLIQRLNGGGLQPIAASRAGGVDKERLDAWLGSVAWGDAAQYDVALEQADPHAVGLFVKPTTEQASLMAKRERGDGGGKKDEGGKGGKKDEGGKGGKRSSGGFA